MQNDIKLFLVSSSFVDKFLYIDELIKNDTIILNRNYSSNKLLDDKYYKFISKPDIEIGYNNNSFIFCSRYDHDLICLDENDINNHNLFFMNISDFNNISELILSKYNILIVWLDTKQHNSYNKLVSELSETKYLEERLEYTDYMYFLDEDPESVSKVLVQYVNGTNDIRQKLIEENS